MATATCSLFSLSLPSPTLHPSSLSARALPPRAILSAPRSLSSTASYAAVPIGVFGTWTAATRSWRSRGLEVVCEATRTGRRPDSVKKRERQNETRRIRNSARKAEMRTRMKKIQMARQYLWLEFEVKGFCKLQVFKALEKLRKKADAQPEEILPIEKMISEAYKAIDKTVKVGAIHRNTGAHRKSRLARRKKAIEIVRGWYVPNAEPSAAA